MTTQPTLFGDAPVPAHNGTATSKAAAESVRDGAAKQRQRVYDALYATSRWGATREELERLAGITGNAVRPRVKELLAEKRITETDRTRRTRSGRNAVVLIAAAWVLPVVEEDDED